MFFKFPFFQLWDAAVSCLSYLCEVLFFFSFTILCAYFRLISLPMPIDLSKFTDLIFQPLPSVNACFTSILLTLLQYSPDLELSLASHLNNCLIIITWMQVPLLNSSHLNRLILLYK